MVLGRSCEGLDVVGRWGAMRPVIMTDMLLSSPLSLALILAGVTPLPLLYWQNTETALLLCLLVEMVEGGWEVCLGRGWPFHPRSAQAFSSLPSSPSPQYRASLSTHNPYRADHLRLPQKKRRRGRRILTREDTRTLSTSHERHPLSLSTFGAPRHRGG